jgi:hypothetical protein
MWPCIVTNFIIIKPTRCTNFSNVILEMKLYIFRTVPLSIISSYSLYTQKWYMSYRFVGSFREAGSGWNCSSILILLLLLLLLLESCLQTCMTYTIAECTVNGQRSCPKHVEFHFQNKIWEISASCWFYYKETRKVLFRGITQRTLKMETVCCSETLLSTRLHGVTKHNTII